VLGSLAERHLIDDLTIRRLQASCVPPAQQAMPPRQATAQAIALPDPHPLDFDWRWTAQTAISLVARCTGTTGPDGHDRAAGYAHTRPPRRSRQGSAAMAPARSEHRHHQRPGHAVATLRAAVRPDHRPAAGPERQDGRG